MTLGAQGERAAAAYLQRKGHCIITTNYRCRVGEIDIVSVDRDVVVFSEVKTRRTRTKGQPFESVTHRKQVTLRRVAEHFLLCRYGQLRTCRFDVVSLQVRPGKDMDVLHIENAF